MKRRAVDDRWAACEVYEPYVGRWSRLVGRALVDWLAEPPDRRWLDVGCGTGVLSQVILDRGLASRVVGIDPSEDSLAYAREAETHPAVSFRLGSADSLAVEDAAFDVAVSGLVLDLLADPGRGVAEMRRAVAPGGTVAAYLWDYAGEMQIMRRFWDAANPLDPAARTSTKGGASPSPSRSPWPSCSKTAAWTTTRHARSTWMRS